MTLDHVVTSTAAVNTAGALDYVTILRTVRPERVGKSYDFVDGALTKTQAAVLTEAVATSWFAESLTELGELLSHVTEQTNEVLVPAIWHGDTGEDFRLVTEPELGRLTGLAAGALGGIHRTPDGLVAARLRRGLDASPFLFLDADEPPGFPDEWRAWSLQQRAEYWDGLIPGFSQLERVQLRGSSARVRHRDEAPRGPSHAYVRVDDAGVIERFKENIRVRMVTEGRWFRSPRFSRTTGAEIGASPRSVFDLSVWVPGRIVFCARPVLSQRAVDAGYVVDGAGVEVVNQGGGALDVSGYGLPDDELLTAYQTVTRERLSYSAGGSGGLAVRSAGVLTYATPIEARGVVRTMGEWIDSMTNGQRVRCEAPFRASVSEAAVLVRTGAGMGFVHDVGVSTTYTLDPADVGQRTAQQAHDLGARLRDMLGNQAASMLSGPAVEARGHSPERASIMVVDGDEHITLAATLDALPSLEPPIFRHAGRPARVSDMVEIEVVDNGERRTVTTTGIRHLKNENLQAALSEKVDFLKQRGRNVVRISAPLVLMNAVTGSGLPTVPEIKGIATTPYIKADGTLMTANGFDPDTGVWLSHDLAVTMPEAPGLPEAMAALETLSELVSEFPFDSPLDRAVALAALMAAVLRAGMVSLPGLLIDAAAAGTGKSYLTQVIGVLGLGKTVPVSNWPVTREELDKHLDGLILAGLPFVAFDNCNGVAVGGHKLCTIITESTVQTRPLGTSSIAWPSTRGVQVIVNGNHPAVKEDATQRFVRCYMVSELANPRTRTFQDSPLSRLAGAGRGKYVSAILTMVRAYVLAGEPRRVGYASFDMWSRRVRSVLMWLGLPDVLASTQALIAEDPETLPLVSLGEAWRDIVGIGQPATVAEFVTRLASADASRMMALGGTLGARMEPANLGASVRDAVGKVVRGGQDRVFMLGDRTVVFRRGGTAQRGVYRWRLLSAGR